MRHIGKLLLLVGICLFISCSEDDSTLVTNSVQLSFSTNGGSQPFSIQSDADWSIYDLPEWLEASNQSGIGNAVVTLSAEPNNEGVRREGIFNIRTNDTKNILTIKVMQTGSLDGDVLIVEDRSTRYLSGNRKLNDEDIIIKSSLHWKAEGPSWLRASFNDKFIELDGSTSQSGSGILTLHVWYDNSDEDLHEGKIRLTAVERNIVVEIPVAQLGCYDVECVHPVILSDAFACDFKYGTQVASFRAKTFRGTATEADLTVEKLNSEWSWAQATDDMEYLSSIKPNTAYTFYMRGITENNYYVPYFNIFPFQTPTDENQPRVLVSNIELRSDGWHYTYVPNEYAIGYYRLIYTSNVSYSKAKIAHTLNKRILTGTSTLQGAKKQSVKNSTKTDLTIITWAVGNDGKLSNVMDVYRAIINEQ